VPILYTVSSVSAQLADQPLLIVACALIIGAFVVAGLLIQHEHDTQQRIADQVDRNHTAHAVQSGQSVQAVRSVPLAGVLDGGAPLPTIALVDIAAPATSPATPSAPTIPDEIRIGRIGDIAEQPTQIIPAADMAAMAAATAARDRVPPEILEALGARWILAMPWALPDNALN